MNKQDFLTLHIDYEETIPLQDFKNCLEGWNNQYYKHFPPSNNNKDENILLVKKVKEGSIEIELVTALTAALPLITDVNNIVMFYNLMKKMLNWLSTKKGKKPEMDKEDLGNIKKISDSINCNGRSINFTINGDNAKVTIIDNVKAEIISRNTNEELAIFQNIPEVPGTTITVNNVVLKLMLVEDYQKNNKNTKGIIHEIDNKRYPVMFAEGLKHEITHDLSNPLRKKYLADVKIEKENDKIKSYTVLKINDTYNDEDDSNNESSLFNDNL